MVEMEVMETMARMEIMAEKDIMEPMLRLYLIEMLILINNLILKMEYFIINML
jgi:hypothetical protein